MALPIVPILLVAAIAFSGNKAKTPPPKEETLKKPKQTEFDYEDMAEALSAAENGDFSKLKEIMPEEGILNSDTVQYILSESGINWARREYQDKTALVNFIAFKLKVPVPYLVALPILMDALDVVFGPPK